MAIASINPATGETLQTFVSLGQEQLDARIQLAHTVFQSYRRTSFAERAGMMLGAAEILEAEKKDFARTMTLEMGKPIKGAVQEAEKCAWVCRYYAENAGRHLASEIVETNATKSYVCFQPLGVVLAVMPWNFPFWQVFRFAAPALMAGNVGLLKHSCIAGKQIKKTVLELGGSDPFIVMPSADLEAAVTTAVKARTINNGQSCIAAKRFIVHTQIYDEFEKRFVEVMKQLRVGDPLIESTDIGPLATEQILKDIEEQVQVSVAAGAKILTGGQKFKAEGDLARGNFYEPTVLVDIPKGSPAYQDEIFGPVASLFRVANIDGAIELANATPFGLGSAVWTNDDAERSRFIEELEAGSVFINGMVASDPRLPFGGTKHSGYGRELGEFGIREFVNIKTVWIK